MNTFDPFSCFDPLQGTPAWHEPIDLRPVIQRARYLLRIKHRTNDQVHAIASSIDWMIDAFFREQEEDMVKREAGEYGRYGQLREYLPPGVDATRGSIRWLLESGLPARVLSELDYMNDENTNEVTALKECIKGYLVSNDEEVPNASDFEYFAVLALRLVGRSLDAMSDSALLLPGSDAKCPNDTQRMLAVPYAATSALDAMDAVCHAEHLRMLEKHEAENCKLAEAVKATKLEMSGLQETLETLTQTVDSTVEARTKERISLTNSRAAIKGHAENRALQKTAIDHYRAHATEFPSIEAAAEAIAGRIVPVKHRTVVSWISRHLQNKKNPKHAEG